jgi:hypothetical protein
MRNVNSGGYEVGIQRLSYSGVILQFRTKYILECSETYRS